MGFNQLHDNEELEKEIAKECNPCKRSGIKKIECDFVEDGFEGRGELVRIYCFCEDCDKLMDIRMDETMFWKDDFRTEFGKKEDAIKEFNERFGEKN